MAVRRPFARPAGGARDTALACLLLALVRSPGADAKTFEVVWAVPDNGLTLPSVSTAKCGDTIRFKCPPGVMHGLFKMSAYDGSCPSDFSQPSAGIELAPPEQSCEFLLELKDEQDYVVTSHAGGDCNNNLKMHIHSVCIQGATSASAVLGSSSSSSALISGASTSRMRRAAPGGDGPAAASAGAAAADGIGHLEAGSLQDHQQQQHRLAQHHGSLSAATRPSREVHLRASNSAGGAGPSSRPLLLAAVATSSLAAAALLLLF